MLKNDGIKTFKVLQKLLDYLEEYASIYYSNIGSEAELNKAYWLMT